MSQSHSLSDYFALEAGDFLDQLDTLLGREGAPDAERFFRLARGVRGSARVAQESRIAPVADALEGAARAVHERALPWSEEVRALAVRTVDDLKVLIRARGNWSAAEDERAAAAAAHWEGIASRRGSSRAGDAAGSQFLGFLRREVTEVVSELDHAADALRRAPGAREPLQAAVRRMRPLRGMTGVDALAPVQEVLEGVEEGAGVRDVDALLELLTAARAALVACLGAAERGAWEDDLPELERFRDARDRVADASGDEAEDVIPVATLFYDDAGPHVLSSPLAPVPETGESAAEEVDRFLRLEATGFLDRAEALLADLPPRREKRFGGVAAQLAKLAQAVGELSGTYGVTAVADAAGEVASELRGASSAGEARAALSRLRAALPGATAGTEAAPAPAPAFPESAGEADADVIPIEALLLRGAPALREALTLRSEVERLAATGEPVSAELRGRLDELFDLIRLGLEAPAGS